ncbi:hypothetical protein D3C78_1208080 [compost metagenome]
MAVQAFEFLENHLQLVIGNAWAAVPDLQPQLAAVSADTEQDRALAVAEGIGQEVLQDPPQQFHVAVHPQAAGAYAKIQALLLGQYLEFGPQGGEQLVQGKRLGIRGDLAVFQARDIEQVTDQFLG